MHETLSFLGLLGFFIVIVVHFSPPKTLWKTAETDLADNHLTLSDKQETLRIESGEIDSDLKDRLVGTPRPA